MRLVCRCDVRIVDATFNKFEVPYFRAIRFHGKSEFKTIPNEYIESPEIDGKRNAKISEPSIHRRIARKCAVGVVVHRGYRSTAFADNFDPLSTSR